MTELSAANTALPGVQHSAGPAGGKGIARFSAMQFLIALILMILIVPFVERMRGGDLIEAALISIVLLSAVVAIDARPRTRLIAIALVAPAVLGRWTNHYAPGLIPAPLVMGTAVIFALFVVGNLLGFVLRARRVNANVLCAASSAYLMLGVTWAFAYALVGKVVHDSFVFTISGTPQSRPLVGFESLYFSFTTLSTVSYGDIIPACNAARLLAMTESVLGVFYMTVLIARLVSLYHATTRVA
jgi:hypothetical protein